MVKISHETPLCLLEFSRQFNDYDYCLPHLMDNDESYRDFFLKSKELKREIFLDNSLHELGFSYDKNRLLYWIEELRPSSFFIPDVWEDFEKTYENALEWSKIDLPDGVEKIVIVQGKSIYEARLMVKMYKKLGYKRIAFPYGSSYYDSLFYNPNENIRKALGRVLAIGMLVEDGYLTDDDNVHLLGTACPVEFPFYKDYKFIKSVDTSNPVMAALEFIEYNKLGIHEKPKSNLNSHFNVDFTNIDLELLFHNVNSFRDLFKN